MGSLYVSSNIKGKLNQHLQPKGDAGLLQKQDPPQRQAKNTTTRLGAFWRRLGVLPARALMKVMRVVSRASVATSEADLIGPGSPSSDYSCAGFL